MLNFENVDFYVYLFDNIKLAWGVKGLNTQRNIALNALMLLVRKNDPTLFDNPAIFEKNLVSNGCIADSEEVQTLKQSLSCRLPWKVRKSGNTIEISAANLISSEFTEKADVPLDLAIWATRAWISALGIKLITAEQDKEVAVATQDIVKNSPVAEEKTNSTPRPEAFSNPGGRLGIVFGEDSNGMVKVFNAWYNDASKSETSGMAAIPVKLKSEPVILFKSAIKKSEKPKDEVEAEKKKMDTETDDAVSTKASCLIQEQPAVDNTSDNLNSSDTEYDINPIEKKAMSIIQNGEQYAYEVIKMLAPIAKAGSAFSCRLIGELYYRGHGVKQDFNAAKAWLDIAANKGDAESQYLVGNIYQFGMGVKQDITVAMQYFKKAAEQGHKKALESINLINGLVGY